MSADGSVWIVFPTRVIPLAHYDWATQEGAKSTSSPPPPLFWLIWLFFLSCSHPRNEHSSESLSLDTDHAIKTASQLVSGRGEAFFPLGQDAML